MLSKKKKKKKKGTYLEETSIGIVDSDNRY